MESQPLTFVDGSPFVYCGVCGKLVRLIDAERQKISVVIDYEPCERYVNKTVTVHTWARPVIKVVPGCEGCYYAAEQAKAQRVVDNEAEYWAQLALTEKVEATKTYYKPKEEYTTVWSGHTPLTQGFDKTARMTQDMYGPYNDRKEKK